ncbi:metallophosphoesterase family protein [Thermotoga profunda]|uniref:metallophosphoesterase family protein n=1 Tax=Thermotoga profunda TaxID=1508420 RepID=UPI000596BBF0|nr:metallophosphoesterase family protein [Thermotoga profunda]
MIYAIGDIHGCVESLNNLMDRLPLRTGDKLIFLGDYVDRGPDSKAVVDRLMILSQTYDCVFLRGNHEWMMLNYLLDGKDFELWMMNGAGATIRSYKDVRKIPLEHLEFFKNTVYYHIEDGYFFVHAGVRPHIPLERQDTFDLLWIREEFIYSENPLKGYKVVFGHTPFNDVLVLHDKIGIDTGCVYGGKLTALRIDDGKVFQTSCGGD